jgi:uncharacterized protein YsxB (DUF464 family)
MTKINFYRDQGVFYGFEEQGHTGYGEEGDDVLCAALSAMTMLIINSIELGYASNVDYYINEGGTLIRVRAEAALPDSEPDERKQFAVAGLFQSYFYQLNDLVEEYYDFLEVNVVDKPYDPSEPAE